MKMNAGVEWAVHACGLLAGLAENKGLPAEALAAYFDLPPAYMAKQMQALSKAGLVVSHRGKAGGYRLARVPAEISLWDIMAAVEGSQPAFRCTEIRQRGPCGQNAGSCKRPCPINRAFLAAEERYRAALAQVSLAEISVEALQDMGPDTMSASLQWLAASANTLK